MSHTLGICEERAEKEETSEYQAQLPRLLGVFSVRFQLNLKILVITAGEEKIYRSMDSMVDKNTNGETELSVEFLSLHCPSGLPPHLAKLKVCAFIIWSYFRYRRRINRWDKTGGNTSCDKHIPSISSGGTCHALGERSFG
jgi:hypothetical protein